MNEDKRERKIDGFRECIVCDHLRERDGREGGREGGRRGGREGGREGEREGEIAHSVVFL